MKKVILRLVLVTLVLCGTTIPIIAQWVQKTNMPTPRTVLSVAEANGKIYAIGGLDGASPLNNVEEYDPSTDTWIKKKRMPTSRGYFTSCTLDGEIYSIGGYDPATTGTVEKYNPITNTWEEKASLQTRRWGHGACTVNGKIYVIGGATGWPGSHKNSVEEYDPSTDTWIYKTSMPTKRWMLSCSVVNGKIYAIGGCDVSNVGTSAVEEYDPSTDTWTSKSPMPTARYGLTTGVVNGKIYAIGGGDKYPPNQCYKLVEVYDPATDEWSTNTDPLPVGRIGCSSNSASVDSKVYVIGGGGTSGIDVFREVYALDLTTEIEDISLNPEKFLLSQNYPNPFNPSTIIKYSIPEQCYVTVKVFDVLGREIAVLVNEEKPTGNYSVEFDASVFTSGIYFYGIEAGEFVQIKKMILIK